MKLNIKILMGMLFLSSIVFAQRGEPARSNDNELHSSVYGAATTSFSKLNDKNALLVGAYAGWLINHRLMIGAGGYGLATKHKGIGNNLETNDQNELRMGYGGLVVEYRFISLSSIHISANTLIGGGEISNGYQRKTNSSAGSKRWASLESTPIYVIKPAINAEVNVNSWFAVSAGAGYRFIFGNEISGLSDRKLSAPSIDLSLKFGSF